MLYVVIVFLELLLGFRDSMPRIVNRIVFVFPAIVGDALNDHFGVVATSESAFRIGPIVLGLAFVVAGHRPRAFLVVAKMPGRFGRIFMNREIAERVDRIAFLARLDDEFLWKFPIGESRQAKHARRVRRCQIAAKLIGEAVQQRFRFVLTESAHFPYDLVLAGRGIKDKVRRWH